MRFRASVCSWSAVGQRLSCCTAPLVCCSLQPPNRCPCQTPPLQAAAKASLAVGGGPVQWVCGELAGVEVEVCNPAAVGMRVSWG